MSEGCRNCYARAIYERYGKDFSRVEMHEDKLDRLLHTHIPQGASKRGPGRRPLCFVCDTGDLLHPEVSIRFIIKAFHIMAVHTMVDWAVLTKRPERIHAVLGALGANGAQRQFPNLWLGVTAENQERAEERIPLLMEWQGIRWVSVEPMLGPVDLTECAHELSWVVCGGESGPKRRYFNWRWADEICDVCATTETPFFYKQGSGLYPGMDDQLPVWGQVHEWPESL